MRRKIDMVGRRFGRLTVIEEDGVHIDPFGKRHIKWRCVCDCGNETTVFGYNLRRKNTLSCGCLQKERKGTHTTHGLSNTRLYSVWKGMVSRCTNPNHKYYENYGGRGITVCQEWINDFAAFHKWAYANGYNETAKRGQCTIDRIDNNKGYCPGNCRFADAMTQRHNRRTTGRNRMMED